MDRNDIERVLEAAFADTLGFTRHEWRDIEEFAILIRESGLFKGDPLKCTVSAFILWYETQGYCDANNIPDSGLQ